MGIFLTKILTLDLASICREIIRANIIYIIGATVTLGNMYRIYI